MGDDAYEYADSKKMLTAKVIYMDTQDINRYISDLEHIMSQERGCYLSVEHCLTFCDAHIMAGRIDDARKYLELIEAKFPPSYGVIFSKYRKVNSL